MLIQGTLRGPGVRRRRGSERLLSQVRDVWPEQLSPWWSLNSLGRQTLSFNLTPTMSPLLE